VVIGNAHGALRFDAYCAEVDEVFMLMVAVHVHSPSADVMAMTEGA
jgi:hypothetical protein